MAPVISKSGLVTSAAGYPLNASGLFDAEGASVLIAAIACAPASDYSVIPTATFDGIAMTFLGRNYLSSGSGSAGCSWLFGIKNPGTGSKTFAMNASAYNGGTICYLLAINGTAEEPFESVVSGGGEPSFTLNVTTTIDESLIVMVGQTGTTNGNPLSVPSGWTSFINSGSLSTSVVGSVITKLMASAGSASGTFSTDYNRASGVAVVLAPLGGVPNQDLNLTSLINSNLFGEITFTRDSLINVSSLEGIFSIGSPLVKNIDIKINTNSLINLNSDIGEISLSLQGLVLVNSLLNTTDIGDISFDLEEPPEETLPLTLGVGESFTVKVRFSPIAAGTKTGNITFVTNYGNKVISITGSTATVEEPEEPTGLLRLHIEGNQFVNSNNETVRLKTLNWHGAESGNKLPHAQWDNPPNYPSLYWKRALDHIKEMGFNCIRFPFSGNDCCAVGSIPAQGSISTLNADLSGITTFEAWGKFFDYCNEIGLYVVLDYHRNDPGGGAPPGFIDNTANWLANWGRVATYFKDYPAIIGADLFNEPYTYTWSAWATLAEQCGNHLLSIAPDWLIFVEGTTGSGGDSTWWGGYLKEVVTRPIVLNVASKVAYSPHEYGQSVGSKVWLKKDGNTVANWPNNLYAIWRYFWGFIFEDNIAPIWIGEFGGHYGLDAQTGVSGAHSNATEEEEWTTTLIKYLNGDFNGDGNSNLTDNQKGMSASYWTFGPESGDTGGLVIRDYRTEQTHKMEILEPFLTA